MTRTRFAAWTSLALGAALAAAPAACAPPAPPAPPPADRPQRLPTARIRVGDHPLTVEVADTESERRKGLMFRKSLRPDEAMLFVFQAEENLAFWMKNCYVDLDLAFIAADGRLVQIERLRAHDTDSVYSRQPVRFALEVPAGWFEAHGLGPGTQVAIPPDVARPTAP